MKQMISLLSKRTLTAGTVLILLTYFTLLTGCDKKDDAGFTAAFSYTFDDQNHVIFTNESTGDYYSVTWDFGNGQTETTTDKNKVFTIYYPEAGDYAVSLRCNGYSGGSSATAQTVKIAVTDLEVTFTTAVNPDKPNYVLLKNTTQGEYDSFRWRFLTDVVENEMETEAYFPLAGSYLVELEVTKNDYPFSAQKYVTITQDDPDYDYLIWSEEFNYTGLPDPAKWNMETGGNGWGNNELQYYTDSENNAKVEGGVLTITARKETFGGRAYTSARITTQNKFDFRYGRIEARIRLPYGQGIWPAFWMLGANFSSVGWPACGEIDIMEMVGGTGGDNTVYSTLHWQHDGSHADYGDSYSLSSGVFADDFHVFAIQWNDQKVTAYVDDIEYFVISITPDQLSEFHENFFVILNVAVGGNWPGPPDATTTFPQTMEVDYIRVYENRK